MVVEELALLRSKVSIGALHNSGERYNAPRCHPGTRLDIQADIMKWLDDVDDPELVLWMYGSAGVGKSAIIQAIASLCYDSNPRRLAGAFFLSRTVSTESRQDDEKHLVATLAYQMTNNIPCLDLHIATAIARNRLIFDLDIETQIKELILDPLAILSNETRNKTPPMIFIVDALDECSSIESQARIIHAFVTVMGKMQYNIPHKLLIASRPESNIKAVFAAAEISLLVRSVSLDDKYKAQDDIRKFLIDSFVRFRETHPSPSIFPTIWPEDDDIDRLVLRSSGQFIYASTAQKYIQEQDANPVLRLQIILDLAKDPLNQPFMAIDALYSHIFGQVKELEAVLNIMSIIRCCWGHFASITFCESLLGLPKGSGVLALQTLSSVGKVDNNKFQAYHASLSDFLGDEHRAGNFYIYSDKISIKLFRLALEYIPALLEGEEPHSDNMQFPCCVIIAAKCVKHVQGHSDEIHKILSTFNIDLIFQVLRKTKHWGRNFWLSLCSSFFGWLVREHRTLARSRNMILLRPFSQLQKWVRGQFERFQLDKLISRHSLSHLEENLLYKDAEMYLIQWGLIDSWVTTIAPQDLTEDRITQLMSRYCYYILNSPWLDIIRNASLNLTFHAQLPEQDSNDRDYHILHLWMFFFARDAPIQIDRYLDIRYILGRNSWISAAESSKEFQSQGRHPSNTLWCLISELYKYQETVEKEFSCLSAPLNNIEEATITAEELVLDQQSFHHVPHRSDSPPFTLALTFKMIHHIEYRDIDCSYLQNRLNP